jgi:hypothetical protein
VTRILARECVSAPAILAFVVRVMAASLAKVRQLPARRYAGDGMQWDLWYTRDYRERFKMDFRRYAPGFMEAAMQAIA